MCKGNRIDPVRLGLTYQRVWGQEDAVTRRCRYQGRRATMSLFVGRVVSSSWLEAFPCRNFPQRAKRNLGFWAAAGTVLL